MLAGVANCGRSQKWGYRGRFQPGFNPRHSNHSGWNHMVLVPPLPSPGYHVSGQEIEVCGSGSPRFFPVIHARLAGLPWFPAPSAVSSRSPVLNPNPFGTFSLPTSESPFTPFLPTMPLLHSSKPLRESSACLLHLAFLLPRPYG